MFLFEDPRLADTLLERTQHVSLEAETDFQDLFVDQLIFKKK